MDAVAALELFVLAHELDLAAGGDLGKQPRLGAFGAPVFQRELLGETRAAEAPALGDQITQFRMCRL